MGRVLAYGSALRVVTQLVLALVLSVVTAPALAQPKAAPPAACAAPSAPPSPAPFAGLKKAGIAGASFVSDSKGLDRVSAAQGMVQDHVENYERWYARIRQHVARINSMQFEIDFRRWREANGFDAEAVKNHGYGWLAYKYAPDKLLPLYEKYATGKPVSPKELPYAIYERRTDPSDLMLESRPDKVLDHMATALGHTMLEKQFMQETGWRPRWRVVVFSAGIRQEGSWEYFAVRTDGEKSFASQMRTYYSYNRASGSFHEWASEAHFNVDPAHKPSKFENYDAVKQRYKNHRVAEYKLTTDDAPGFKVDLEYRVKDLPAIPLYPGPGDRGSLQSELQRAHDKAKLALDEARARKVAEPNPVAPAKRAAPAKPLTAPPARK